MDLKLPKGLRHIMDVYRLVRKSNFTRIEAIKEVSRIRRITSRSVTSACTRDIQINSDELDDFLIPGNANNFCQHLIRRFPTFQKDIEEFINSFDKDTTEIERDDFGLKIFFPEEKDNLLRGVLLMVVIGKLSRWLIRTDLPIDLKTEIEELKKQLEKA